METHMSWEQTSVSELEVGDTVRFADMTWVCADKLARAAAFPNPHHAEDYYWLPNEATVEREVKPKTVKLQLTMESLPLDQALGIYNICPVTSPQIAEIKARHGWVVTSLKEVVE